MHDRKDRRATLSETIDKSDWSTQVRTVIESEIHHRLADLELPLYLTTNTDNFMTLALQAKGLEARQEVIDWREKERQESGRPHYDLDPQPNEDEPVVLHLFGTDGDLLSMVVTEDDYLDYLTRIARDHEYLLPTSVHEALASTTLLFLGYRLEDLDMKVIMRGLLTNLDLERWGMLHVAVQIENTDVGEEEQQEIIRYFQKYFSTAKIDIYWGNTHQFVADLHARWQEYMND
ncbi:MAG: SIR2 family protein [Chloroflexota bacterium]